LFFASYLVILFSARYLGFFPLITTSETYDYFSSYLYFIAPIFTLAVFNGEINEVSYYLHSAMERQKERDYMRTARAKGANEYRHLFPLGIAVPLVTMFTSKFPIFLSQAVIVEAIFNFNGMGNLAWRSASQRDYPVLLGMIILLAIILRILSTVKGVFYRKLQPGIEH